MNTQAPALSLDHRYQTIRQHRTPINSAKPAQPAKITFGAHQDSLKLSSKEYKVPKQLQKRIEAAATVLYGKKQAEEVSKQINDIIVKARKNRPADLLKEDYERPTDWYKNEQAYMFYAERFGTKDGKPNTFKNLIPMLDYMKNLGVSTIYLLPFLESPMIDAGFDVSDYKQVRKDLGGNEEFDEFLAEARKKGFRVKADLVLNHVSDKHKWFQAALKGDPDKLQYFLSKDEAPKGQLETSPKDGAWVTYQEKDGGKTKRRLIFPDISNTHYRQEKVNGKDKHFYYTFYPHQMDLNWSNPKVMYEALDVMGHWANKGIDIFRLDALPFFVKPPKTIGENTPGTHAAIQILSAALQAISPRSVLWAEACQAPSAIKPYFGEESKYALNIPGQGPKLMKRTDKVQIAYHFPEMTSLWATLLTKKPDEFWQTMKETPNLPDSSAWSKFLRVHDELSMEMLDKPELQKTMNEILSARGESFRAGQAVGGRLASFLDNDPKRIGLSYSMLYSLPGMPLMYYGDEIGEVNNRDFMHQAAAEREKQAAHSGAAAKSFIDARDIGRAPISQDRLFKAMNQPDSPEGKIYHHVKRLIEVRKQEPALTKGSLSKVPADQEHIFSYLREYENQRILLAHNLSGENSTVKLSLPKQIPVKSLPSDGVKDLQSERAIPLKQDTQGNEVELSLKPYESVWLKMPEANSKTGKADAKNNFTNSIASFFNRRFHFKQQS